VDNAWVVGEGEPGRQRSRRGVAAVIVGLATVAVAGLCLVGTTNVAGYLVVNRLAGHPIAGVMLTAVGAGGVAVLMDRRRRTRVVALSVIALAAACCLGGQLRVGDVGWRPAQHVLAHSPDRRASVLAYEYAGLADNWIEFRLRSHRGWRSREVCLDRVADAVSGTVAARFVDPHHVELIWLDGALINTWVITVDTDSLDIHGDRGC
jgi:hypothetical protein